MRAHIKSVIIAAQLRPILAVQLSDTRLGATLRSLCLLLSLNLRGQQQRIQRDPVLRRALVTATVSTRQGTRNADVLLAWAIPIWLVGLEPSRLPPEKQALVILLQERAVEAIYQAFLGTPQGDMRSEQTMLPEEPPEGIHTDSPPAARLEALEGRQNVLENRQDALDERMGQGEIRLGMLETQFAQLISQLRQEARLRENDERLLAATIARLMSAHPLSTQHRSPERGRPRKRKS